MTWKENNNQCAECHQTIQVQKNKSSYVTSEIRGHAVFFDTQDVVMAEWVPWPDYQSLRL